jgi:hypothetical protein
VKGKWVVISRDKPKKSGRLRIDTKRAVTNEGTGKYKKKVYYLFEDGRGWEKVLNPQFE